MHTLLKPIRYVFYRILQFKLRDRQEPTPILVAALCTFLLLFFNAMGLMMTINIVLGRHPILPAVPWPALAAVVLAASIVGYQIMKSAWVERDGYSNLVREFESNRQNRVRAALFWAYIVVSVGLPVFISVLWFGADSGYGSP